MPSCSGFLETRKSTLGPLKSRFNDKNFLCSLSMSILISFGTIRSWNVSCSPKSPKKSMKIPILEFKVIKVIEFGGNGEPVYDFLLVIDSNLGPISHRYWDTATYWPKIANFSHPFSFSTLVWGEPLQIYGKALWFLKLESSRQPMVKTWLSKLAPFLTDPPVWQTDGQTELRWLRPAESSSCFRM